MLHIPENLTDFLYWIKEQTEAYWRQHPRDELVVGYYEEWPAGVHWVGMSEADIDRVEAIYNVRFTPDHREFLRILHALNQPYTYVEETTNEHAEDRYQKILFYNWLTDEAEIRRQLAQPYKDLCQDWLLAWGARPDSEEERAAGFARQFSKAPALLPLLGHRYMVSEPPQPGNPVLSVWSSDIIVYGWNLRSYLLHELRNYLGIEFGRVLDWEDKPEIAAIFQDDDAAALTRRIPFYEDYIQTYDG